MTSGSVLAMVSSWALLALGVAHIVFGVVKFRQPLWQALSSGLVGQFAMPEVRRSAFWFVMFGLPLLLAGHVAVHAAGRGDLALMQLVARYVLASSVIGVMAFPRSPFLLSLIVAVMLVLAGHGF
jgi:Family of unknown function (DUF6463)